MSTKEDIVNYLDIKLESVHNLPPEWTQGMPTDTALYAQNPFRYEVSFTLQQNGSGDKESDAQTQNAAKEEEASTFTLPCGRLLPAVPRYTQYIDAAAPPPLPGTDEVNVIRDFPETMGELQQTGDALEDPTSPSAGNNAPLKILWAVTHEEAPPSLAADDKKVRKKAQSVGSVGSNKDKDKDDNPPPLPPLPDSDEQPPCVIRVPLTASLERVLEQMVRQKKNLEMRFRRTLKPHLPAEWEDMNAKYYEATIPISLQAFSTPGSVELQADAALVPLPVEEEAEPEKNTKKKAAARKAAKSGQPPTMYEEAPQGPHQYVTAETKATVKLHLRHTLTRLSSDRVRPNWTPSQLIPTRAKTTDAAPVQEVTKDYEEAIEDMATHLLKEYYEVNPDEAHIPAASLEEREARRVHFLDYFQSTGQILAYSTKLSALVLRIIEDKFRIDPSNSAEDLGKLQNELYVYLLEHMHMAIQRLMDTHRGNKTRGEVLGREEDEERGDSKVGDKSEDPIAATIALPNDEPTNLADVWYQRALEAEITGDFNLASSCHQSRIASYEGSQRYPELWTDAGAYYTRIGDSAQAEVCYREAIACDPTYLPALLGYGMWLLVYDRLKEAAVFLHSAVDLAPEDGLPWATITLLNDLHIALLKPGSPNYENELIKWRREREDAMQQSLQRFKTKQPEVTEEQVLFRLAQYAMQLHHRELANVCLCRCESGKVKVEKLYAHLFVQAKQYREALNTLNGLSEMEEECSALELDEMNLLRAQCEAALGHTNEAIRLYKKVLCKDNTHPSYLTSSHVLLPPGTFVEVEESLWRRRSFLVAYIHLGNLLLAEGKYRDALGVFAITIKLWPSCLSWLGAGIAYYRVGNLEGAEECLSESNTINPSNPRTWGYLTLLTVRLQRAGVEDTLQQLRLHNLVDASLWAEIGRELLTIHHNSLAEWCLRRTLSLESGKIQKGNSGSKGQSALSSTTKYYLAQLLAEQQRWEETRELLESVIRHSNNEVLKAKAEEELNQLQNIM